VLFQIFLYDSISFSDLLPFFSFFLKSVVIQRGINQKVNIHKDSGIHGMQWFYVHRVLHLINAPMLQPGPARYRDTGCRPSGYRLHDRWYW
jgi:hypothetical protein